MSLTRFETAQADHFDTALAELRSGRKRSHWMWFIFPQLRGLGRSERARHFGLADLEEARAYAIHPVLGPRLAQCFDALLPHRGTPVDRIMGGIDAMKLRSCATLFERTSLADPARRVLDAFYRGERCPHTLQLIGPVP